MQTACMDLLHITTDNFQRWSLRFWNNCQPYVINEVSACFLHYFILFVYFEIVFLPSFFPLNLSAICIGGSYISRWNLHNYRSSSSLSQSPIGLFCLWTIDQPTPSLYSFLQQFSLLSKMVVYIQICHSLLTRISHKQETDCQQKAIRRKNWSKQLL